MYSGVGGGVSVVQSAALHQVGHKEGEQFTFHWWDHVFNKASSSLQVETDQVRSQLFSFY